MKLNIHDGASMCSPPQFMAVGQGHNTVHREDEYKKENPLFERDFIVLQVSKTLQDTWSRYLRLFQNKHGVEPRRYKEVLHKITEHIQQQTDRFKKSFKHQKDSKVRPKSYRDAVKK